VESKGDDGDVDDATAALPAAHVVLPAAAAGAAALAGGNVGAGAALRREAAGASPEVGARWCLCTHLCVGARARVCGCVAVIVRLHVGGRACMAAIVRMRLGVYNACACACACACVFAVVRMRLGVCDACACVFAIVCTRVGGHHQMAVRAVLRRCWTPDRQGWLRCWEHPRPALGSSRALPLHRRISSVAIALVARLIAYLHCLSCSTGGSAEVVCSASKCLHEEVSIRSPY